MPPSTLPALRHRSRRTSPGRVLEVRTAAGDWEQLAGAAAHLHRSGATALVDAAGTELLPPPLRTALAGLPRRAGAHRALLVRGAPVGSVPATPPTPGAATGKDSTSELVVLSIGRALGEPVGYLAEHGGALVQDLVPTRRDADRQTSTSSSVELEFHTETAFHPHRPRHLVLGCLRGDPHAATYLCAVDDVVERLDPRTLEALWEPRFRTRIDESFGGGADTEPGPPAPVLSGDPDAPTLVYDANLMAGTDAGASAALARFTEVASVRRRSVVLGAGDVLVVDNHACIHGRSSFAPRHDGTDRWLQRGFVVDDLRPTAGERTGRIITTDVAARWTPRP